MDLGSWNRRLAEHFENLMKDREDIPIFALEHGLSQAEVLALSDTIRAQIRFSSPRREHPLVWTTYAVEIGYGYAGDEYWQTFEEKTPGWTEHGDRGWIRDAFLYFHKKYSGAAPTGAWARHFSIICWPITHAILPRDLQQQLAEILYQLRHAFSADLFESPLLLGQFIAARSWNTSARFQNLVQEPALVGQIATALLFQGKEGFKTLLHPMTLKRIGDDLDRERSARDWLRGARSVAEQRAKIRGLALGRPSTTPIHRRDEARAEVVRLGIEPRLVLRPVEGSRWEVSLEIPDLSHLLLRFPQVRAVLTESRCTVAGAAGRPLARGRCLHGPQRVALSRWPKPDEVLLKFEGADQQLEYPPKLQLASLAGSVVHLALEIITKEITRAGVPSLDHPQAIQVLRDLGGYTRVVEECVDRILKRFADNPRALQLLEHVRRTLRGQVPALRGRVQSMLARLRFQSGARPVPSAGRKASAPSRSVLANGTYAELELRARSIGWKGKVDLLAVSDDACVITDFKTGAPDDAHGFQIRVYATLWRLDDELNPSGRLIDRLIVSYERQEIDVPPPSAQEIDDLQNELLAHRKACEAALTEATPAARPSAKACRFCGVRQLCDAYWDGAMQVASDDGRYGDIELTLTARHGPTSWAAVVVRARHIPVKTPALLRFRQSDEFRSGALVRVLDGALAQDPEDESAPMIVTLGLFSEAYVVE